MDLDQQKPIGLENEAEFEASLIGEEATTLLAAPPAPAARAPAPAAPPVAARPSWTGKLLGHFKLLRVLGEGTMGRVIMAQDINLKRIVALKVLRRRIKGVDEAQRVSQFLREARAAALIEHPNVIHIYEINQHDGWWYIAMELLEGGTLQHIVKAAGPLAPAKAAPILADAATALAVAHEAGIVHRDIKPSNLMLTRNGRCKVTDFGLVRYADPLDPFDFTDKSVGTPHYMAPEVVEHKPATPATDVYCLGATLYYALVGTAPFPGPAVKDLLRQQVQSPVPDVRDRAPQCSESMARLIQRAMAKVPDRRPTAADFAAALRAESIGAAAEGSAIANLGTGSWPALLPAGANSGLAPALEGPSGVAVAQGSATGLSTPGFAVPPPPPRRAAWPWALAGAGFMVLVFGILILLGVFVPGPGRSGEPEGEAIEEPPPSAARAEQLGAALARAFRTSPATYGAPDNGTPTPLPPAQPPAFSWVGHVAPESFRFVASKRGRHYYPVNSALAALIHAEDFVGYKTEQEAQADGKTAWK